jgi:hypothetical protein
MRPILTLANEMVKSTCNMLDHLLDSGFDFEVN